MIEEELTDTEKLADCQKENDALRAAIADSWHALGECQHALGDTRVKLAAALYEAAYWRPGAVVSDTIATSFCRTCGQPCEPGEGE